MTESLTLTQIEEHWHAQVKAHGQSPAASWSDTQVIELEIAALLKRINDGERVLDVGCANGYTTLALAAQRQITIRGIDFVPAMIEQARRRAEKRKGQLAGQVEFAVGNAVNLEEPEGVYDCVTCVRMMINLGAWENQARGLSECARVLRPGGTLLLSEATLQGWRRLNDFRREWQLPDIAMPPFNNYLDRDQVIRTQATHGLELADVVHFASSYYVGTRVLKPLLIRALGLPIDAAEPNMEWNRWFAQLPAAGDYGTQELLVFRKLSPCGISRQDAARCPGEIVP
jgi:2-polyprenyl-3-methyl-5-hydroxy-6-metoxy-1,4-benzoquinol methylase